MKAITTTMLSLFCLASLSGRSFEVTNADEVKALKTLSAGDTVILKGGEWKDQVLSVRGNGTEEAPVVIMAETPGAAVFTGASSLSFGGSHIYVTGLWFRDVKPETGAVVNFKAGSMMAEYSTLDGCAITGDGLQEDLTDYKWVSVYGSDNTVQNCTFRDKKNMGTLLVVWLAQDMPANHTIRGNYFSRPHCIKGDDGKARNGQETLRIGTSDYSMQQTHCLVEGNYFYRCNGEVEIISNKACKNTYRRNVFTECEGTLTLRHGNDCVAESNAFFGNGVANTGGIRLIGERHLVYNNYFQDLGGTGYYSALCTVQGENNPKLNGYFAAKDCFVVHNTVVNCAWGINMNHGSSRQTEPVENITVAMNIVTNTKDSKAYTYIIRETPARPIGTLYRDNIVNGGRMRDTDPKEVAAKEADPDIRSYRGFFVPFAKTYLTRNTATGFDFVTTDILGMPRDVAAAVPGAFEGVKKPDYSILPTAETGAAWISGKKKK